MPLRDHFHPPVSQRHAWDELHGQWPATIALQLAPQLPANYTAAPQIHLSGNDEFDATTDEAAATWTATEPTLRVEAEMPELDEYEVRVYDMERAKQLVAAIELVCPSNKDRPETRNAFVTKCAALLQQKVSVTIVDLVTSREANLYAQLLEFIGQKDASVAEPPSNIYTAACRWTAPRKKWLFEAWHQPLIVGLPLPKLPVWLADDGFVTLDLEASYEETCQVLRIA